MSWTIFWEACCVLGPTLIIIWCKKTMITTLPKAGLPWLVPTHSYLFLERILTYSLIAVALVFGVHATAIAEYENKAENGWLAPSDILQYPIDQDSINKWEKGFLNLTSTPKNLPQSERFLFVIDRTKSGTDKAQSDHVVSLKSSLNTLMNDCHLINGNYDSMPLKDLFLNTVIRQMADSQLQHCQYAFLQYCGDSILEPINDWSNLKGGEEFTRSYILRVTQIEEDHKEHLHGQTDFKWLINSLSKKEYHTEESCVFFFSDFEHESEPNEKSFVKLQTALRNTFRSEKGKNIVLIQFPGQDLRPDLSNATIKCFSDNCPADRLFVYDQDFFLKEDTSYLKHHIRNLLRPIESNQETLHLYHNSVRRNDWALIKPDIDVEYYFRLVGKGSPNPAQDPKVSLYFVGKNVYIDNSYTKSIKWESDTVIEVEFSTDLSSEDYYLEVSSPAWKVVKRISLKRQENLSAIGIQLHVVCYAVFICLIIFDLALLLYQTFIAKRVIGWSYFIFVILATSILACAFGTSSYRTLKLAITQPASLAIVCALCFLFFIGIYAEMRHNFKKDNKPDSSAKLP